MLRLNSDSCNDHAAGRPAPEPPKLRRKPKRKAKPREWVEVVGPLSDDGGENNLVKDMPRDGRPCLVSPGMVVFMSDRDDPYALVTAVTKDFCTVRNKAGRSHAIHWHETAIGHVRPDPAYLAGKQWPAIAMALSPAAGWFDVPGAFAKRMPPGTPAAVARLGMLVNVEADCTEIQAVIVGMTAEHCIAVDEEGRAHAIGWAGVVLAHVQPDRAALEATEQPEAPKDVMEVSEARERLNKALPPGSGFEVVSICRHARGRDGREWESCSWRVSVEPADGSRAIDASAVSLADAVSFALARLGQRAKDKASRRRRDARALASMRV